MIMTDWRPQESCEDVQDAFEILGLVRADDEVVPDGFSVHACTALLAVQYLR